LATPAVKDQMVGCRVLELGIGRGALGRLQRMLAKEIQLLVRDSAKIELNFAQMQFIENCCHLFSR